MPSWHGGKLGQTMVDSWYCLDRVVPERMSQVWRRSEVGNQKRFSLNNRLSPGTSANTSCRSRNATGRMIRSDLFWYQNNLKMKPTYREKYLLDYLYGGFRSTLNKHLLIPNCPGHDFAGIALHPTSFLCPSRRWGRGEPGEL